jgi:hypothetical protein
MAGLDVSREQRMSALEYANLVRTYRARMKKEVQAGRMPYDTFLSHGPHDPLLRSMKIQDALRHMPVIGRVKAEKILRAAQVSPSKTLGGLSPMAWERLYIVLESYPTVRRRLSEARGMVNAP